MALGHMIYFSMIIMQIKMIHDTEMDLLWLSVQILLPTITIHICDCRNQIILSTIKISSRGQWC